VAARVAVPPCAIQRQADLSGWAGDNGAVTPGWLVRAGWTGWRRELGWLLIAVALVRPCLASVPWAGAEMPFQDPTPEMLAQQAKDVRAAEALMLAGWAVGLCVLTAGVWLIVWGRHLARRSAQPGASRSA